jgi:hypothetical protein
MKIIVKVVNSNAILFGFLQGIKIMLKKLLEVD